MAPSKAYCAPSANFLATVISAGRANSGGFARAYVETGPVEVDNGQLEIKFTAQVENPQINAREIIGPP